MAWRRSGDKPLSEPMMVSSLTHICVTRPQWVNVEFTAHNRKKCAESLENQVSRQSRPFSVHPCSYPFTRKRAFFFNGRREFAKSRKKEYFFRHKAVKFWKRVKVCMFQPFLTRLFIWSKHRAGPWSTTDCNYINPGYFTLAATDLKP